MISNENCIFIKFILINKIQISISILLIDKNPYYFLLYLQVENNTDSLINYAKRK